MAKFSVHGDDDGEGPSNPSRKRQRIVFPFGTAGEDLEYQSSSEEIEEEVESGQEHEGMQSEENCDDNAPFSNNDDTEDTVSVMKGRDKSISVFLSDPEVLDCFICYEPLSIPVFQCENGHVACSSCCVKIRNKCPLCSMPIGYNRCRAIEKVLESLKIPCLNAVYGCKEMVCFSKRSDHERECICTPCYCPLSSCDFIASSTEVGVHFRHKHVGSGVHFQYDQFFSVFLKVYDKAIVLQEQGDDYLFVLNNKVEHLGNVVSVSCIAPISSKLGFHYELWARSQGCYLKLQSFTKNSPRPIASAPSSAFLLIPPDFFGSSGQLKLDVYIASKVNST